METVSLEDSLVVLIEELSALVAELRVLVSGDEPLPFEGRPPGASAREIEQWLADRFDPIEVLEGE